ncbi:hypothetical protein GCM10009837_34220 [Streptomyces durmitorensis]|uniref:DUF2530 domain-containing protein n=1 Tax=Streptomyces durmitorensis TaxID=319947 RepID=A0ABY4PVL0_9ACTN|nr:hypothetical protein [Streptomyces durmitorensis]UQT57455.1 hypothetical protein M4V62_21390 [Streptomyces durmitorensis]
MDDGTDARRDRPAVSFEPTRPASGARRAVAFLLGALVWIAAAVIGVVLLGHTYILRRLLLVTVISWVVFGAALACGIALRHREERRARP